MRVRALLHDLQNGVARLLGLDPNKRTVAVRTMLHRPRGDATGYWLQLLIAAALATLGLALDSTAVVIGAMLIAPLMRPIVELAMGLATGSAPLIFRTGLRSVASILVVVIASAAFTWLLPFHEPTRELLARTAPSLLDLFVAAACAVAGAYAVVMTSNDVATTAAGTSIGISLVPPLCTAGYGLATRDWDMATRAGLLFTANVTGIITVAGLVFVLIGFGQVDVRAEERELDADEDVGAATRFGRRFSKQMPTRLGLIPRLLFPLALLAAISSPLESAVGAMSRRSTVRKRVGQVLSHSDGAHIVQYTLDQTARPSVLRVIVVGDAASGRKLEQHLRSELEALGERDARVVVWAVPDANALSALAARLDDIPLEVTPPPPEPPPPSVKERLAVLWPSNAGPLLSTWISDGTPARVRVTHLGPELGATARELLSRALADGGAAPLIEEHAVESIEAVIGDEARWLAGALQLADRVRDISAIHLCVSMPPVPKRKLPTTPDLLLTRDTIQRVLQGRSNVTISDGTNWRVLPSVGPCELPIAPTR